MKLSKSTKKMATTILMAAMLSLLMTMVCFAATNYAENAVKWFLDQAFWVVIGAGIFGAIVAGLKRSVTGVIVILIIAAVLAYLCKNPTFIETLSNEVGNVVN